MARVFLSSTATDLLDYRVKIRDAILRLENLPVQMETFSAQPGAPAAECMRLAAEADAVVCIVAHRYGYVPPEELGGDGERSITWLEVAAAKQAGKPVYAFLVDPKAPWTAAKEQDRLVTEPEKAPEIFQAVQQLQKFKSYLDAHTTRALFANPDDLATQVTAALAKLNVSPSVPARVWHPLFCHALQPAPHFRGRAALLADLQTWLHSHTTPDRVLSIVAAGGTGKTALVNESLHARNLPTRAGLFVWSFYEAPQTEAFFRAACTYFTGETNLPAGGLIERLQLALAGNLPHILILDGLELVQSVGGHNRRRGELEDITFKRFIRAMAGGVGSARLLVTSRFPLADLDSFTGAGHRAIILDDLERDAALDVMRAWNVKGNAAALIEPLKHNGTYHALSVAVLASYSANFPGIRFTIEDAQDSDDSKARRLHRILDQYTKSLTAIERDLLSRLSLFPRGAKIEFLVWIAQSDVDVAGSLVGLADQQLTKHLERLKTLGLVFRSENAGQLLYSAHPFLREYFRNLLATDPHFVHESVRAKLAPSLQARPSTPPSDPVILDQYEFLIEQTLLAGSVQVALDLYWSGLGGYDILSRELGENPRGLRILSQFIVDGDFGRLRGFLSLEDHSALVNNLGLFAKSQGDLDYAERAFTWCGLLNAELGTSGDQSNDRYNISGLRLLAGRFPEALVESDRALILAASGNEVHTGNPLCYRAESYSRLGKNTEARLDFARATDLEGEPLYSVRGVTEAEYKLRIGDRASAFSQTEINREIAVSENWNSDLCRCDALLCRLLRDEPTRASQHLESARAFANRAGWVELQLRCYHAATELHRHLGNHPQSIAEAQAGILLADTCGFGAHLIDLRLALAETYLAAGDPRNALQNARAALDRSEHPECQYAWGQADALHLCGLAHQRIGEPELARQRLAAALAIREKLHHPRLDETRRALALL